MLVAVAFGSVLALLRWPPLAIAVLAALGAWWLWRRGRRRREAVDTAARVLEATELMAAELATGRGLGEVLGEAAHGWPPLRAAVEASLLGLDVPEAIRGAAGSPGAHGLTLLAAGWEVAQRTGFGLAEVTAGIAEDLRADLATDRVVLAELASARATAWLVSLLPVLAWAMGSATGGDPLGFLLGGPFGLLCLTFGLALELMGLAWIDVLASPEAR